jgi:hypothetical protein
VESEKKQEQGIGFVVTCAYCGHSRLVRREEVMRGTWQLCPECEERDKED